MSFKKLLGLCLLLAGIGLVYREQNQSSFVPTNKKGSVATIYAFGDATRQASEGRQNLTYAQFLQTLSGRKVINHGTQQLSSQEMLALLPELDLPESTDLVILTIGLEDQKQHVSLNMTYKNLEKIFANLLAKGVMVAFAPATLENTGDNWLMGLEQLCKQFGVIYIPDFNGSKVDFKVHENFGQYDQEYIAKRIFYRLKDFI